MGGDHGASGQKPFTFEPFEAVSQELIWINVPFPRLPASIPPTCRMRPVLETTPRPAARPVATAIPGTFTFLMRLPSRLSRRAARCRKVAA